MEDDGIYKYSGDVGEDIFDTAPKVVALMRKNGNIKTVILAHNFFNVTINSGDDVRKIIEKFFHKECKYYHSLEAE